MHRGIRDGNLSVDERNRASSLDEQETGAGVLELCHDYRNCVIGESFINSQD